MRKPLLLVTLLVAPLPFFLEAVAQAPTGPGSGHGFLIHKHIGAGLNLGEIPCSACHHFHQASEMFCDQCHALGLTPP